MRPDTITVVAKNDALICEFGAKCLRTLAGKSHRVHVTSRRMRELSKVLTEFRRLRPSVTSLLETLHPIFFNALIEATKIVSGYEPGYCPAFVASVGTSLKQCCEIAIEKSLSVPNVDGVEPNLETFVSLIESQWRIDQTDRGRDFNRPKRRERIRSLVPWTALQKDLVVKYFEEHIASKRPPKKYECELLIETYPDLLKNKSWEKIKVFVQNAYTKKTQRAISYDV